MRCVPPSKPPAAAAAAAGGTALTFAQTVTEDQLDDDILPAAHLTVHQFFSRVWVAWQRAVLIIALFAYTNLALRILQARALPARARAHTATPRTFI